MSLVKNTKSAASAIAKFFAPSVFWQRDLTTQQQASVSVQARVLGLRVVVPSIESNCTTQLTIDEATQLSKLLTEAVAQCDQSMAKLEAKQ
jgi:hypothetical protein